MLQSILNLEGVTLLNKLEQKEVLAGRVSALEYCATQYMIRSCNDLSPQATLGANVGWGQANCGQYNGTQLWNASGLSSEDNCDTSWYSY
ncbi:hypothetical protein [Aquimarina sp. 2201CG5-10]|uniref:hypothetical protein n=1 Tax=Aquimarina callyspongiae TaxID=3098150 RepID=UPI002AB32AA1|nr:hypothetical protein [Aquimarina sp. 2201CG5-10]MDY8136981.1 hypothetical protein [Aquimarina sp. 2201CG5-10]